MAAPLAFTRVSPARERAAPVVVAVGAAVACIVVAAFDPRKEAFYPSCPFRAVTGQACAGCGITRGMHELLTGHPIGALRLNVLLAVLVPGALYAYAAWALPRWGGPKLPTFTLTQRNILGAIAVLVLWTVLRNLPWAPFDAFSSFT